VSFGRFLGNFHWFLCGLDVGIEKRMKGIEWYAIILVMNRYKARNGSQVECFLYSTV
jgi:hypothetical protein